MIVCWIRPDNTYYYKFVKGTYCNYQIGLENQYHHKVVLIIENPYIRKIRYSPRQRLRRFVGWIYNNI